ncbi:MAG TPA: glycosyltransferase family 4 protein [Steroidobacteraceae bacterium]|jgi:glycosyltransferase involved in cell wall biosynthesis
MRVAIYHNILWSKYKGVVFSQVHLDGEPRGITPSFIQIAETEEIRVGLSGVDMSYHQYPFRLLFRGAYGSAPLVRRIGALARDLYKNPVDLVIMPGYHRAEYWAMLLVCIALRRKRAVFCDSTTIDQPKVAWRELAKRWFFGWCNGFFCYGIRSKEYLMSYGVSESKIAFRCQAAALPRGYSPAKILEHYETQWQGRADEPVFLYVGRLSVEKGLDDLFAAFCEVYKTLPKARLDLVGSGPLAEELKRRVAKLEMSHAISFLGSKPLDEIAPLFLRSTALVLPSHSEPWGLVINEALSYGCPVVVSSACGCVPDLALDGITGYAFEVGDVDAMAQAMVRITRFSNERPKAAARCLDVISNYTPERAATQILDGCLRMVGNNG